MTTTLYEIPDGFEPDGTARPMVRCEIVRMPSIGSANCIAHVRRLDTGDVVCCPLYGIRSTVGFFESVK